MLTELEVENVRLFEGEGWKLTLPSLTVICGTNSAGKSTLLKAPLVLRQTQGIGEGYGVTDGRLRLSGKQIDLGDYAAFVSGGDTEKDVTIGLGCEGSIDDSIITQLLLLNAKKSGARAVPSTGSPKAIRYTLQAKFRFGLISQRGRVPAPGTDDDCFLKSGTFVLSSSGRRALSWAVRAVPSSVNQAKPNYRLQLPRHFLRNAGLAMMEIDHSSEGEYVEVETVLSGILPQAIRAKRTPTTLPRTRRGARAERRYAIWPLPYPMSSVTSDLQVALADLHYLGPLRSAAERYYVAPSGADPGMDSAGAFLPYVLRDRADASVRYCEPGTERPTSSTLAEALDSWLAYLRTGRHLPKSQAKHELALETTKGVLVEVSLRSIAGDSSHALTDSGFGYSQVLPVLVKGLLAPEGSALIVEQPELHLNPGLQVRLAEFFVGMARCGKQVILETHSEHILNSMRVLAAESASPVSCQIYFIDAAMERPRILPLSVADDGTVANWPPDFFGEASALRARLLQAQKIVPYRRG